MSDGLLSKVCLSSFLLFPSSFRGQRKASKSLGGFMICLGAVQGWRGGRVTFFLLLLLLFSNSLSFRFPCGKVPYFVIVVLNSSQPRITILWLICFIFPTVADERELVKVESTEVTRASMTCKMRYFIWKIACNIWVLHGLAWTRTTEIPYIFM